MHIMINIDDPQPLFSQLVDQIKSSVEKGVVQPGDALPSIRQLANDLEVNSKTVAKAYKLLERDSIIQTRGYRGTFVHPQAKEHCNTDLSQWITERFEQAIGSCRQAGATDSEIRIAFAQVMNNKHR